jgi:hypothetical protein
MTTSKKEELINLRKKHGQTQAEFARRAAVSVRTYQRMECGESSIPDGMLLTLSAGPEHCCHGSAITLLEIIDEHRFVFVASIHCGKRNPAPIVVGTDWVEGGCAARCYELITSGAESGLWVESDGALPIYKTLHYDEILNDIGSIYAYNWGEKEFSFTRGLD